mmetsp:Transcript_4356/g.19505  ORF Transcript_4356/g.19505 Transcript_4356/m.19505 type:complete len:310 (-) Transcript_4356:24-953(-)
MKPQSVGSAHGSTSALSRSAASKGLSSNSVLNTLKKSRTTASCQCARSAATSGDTTSGSASRRSRSGSSLAARASRRAAIFSTGTSSSSSSLSKFSETSFSASFSASSASSSFFEEPASLFDSPFPSRSFTSGRAGRAGTTRKSSSSSSLSRTPASSSPLSSKTMVSIFVGVTTGLNPLSSNARAHLPQLFRAVGDVCLLAGVVDDEVRAAGELGGRVGTNHPSLAEVEVLREPVASLLRVCHDALLQRAVSRRAPDRGGSALLLRRATAEEPAEHRTRDGRARCLSRARRAGRRSKKITRTGLDARGR